MGNKEKVIRVLVWILITVLAAAWLQSYGIPWLAAIIVGGLAARGVDSAVEVPHS